MKPLLVLRPEPGASATVRAARALGFDTVSAPLFTVAAVAWDAPAPQSVDAILLTSANAARLGGGTLATFRHLPVYAVGKATAAAAQAAGFETVIAGDADASAAVALAGDSGVRRLLHLAGREHRAVNHPGVMMERRIVYAAEAVSALPAAALAALGADAVALLHSPRAARLFVDLAGAAGLGRSGISLVAISMAARDAAGSGWATALAAERPTDTAMLAVAARLCD